MVKLHLYNIKMIKYLKKLIKKQKLLKKYKKGPKQWDDHIWLLTKFEFDEKTKHYFEHLFLCELRCYNKLKKL